MAEKTKMLSRIFIRIEKDLLRWLNEYHCHLFEGYLVVDHEIFLTKR